MKTDIDTAPSLNDEFFVAMGNKVMGDYLGEIEAYTGPQHVPHLRAIACLSCDISMVLDRWMLEHESDEFNVDDFLDYFYNYYQEPVSHPQDYIEQPFPHEKIRIERALQLMPHLKLKQFLRPNDENGNGANSDEYVNSGSLFSLRDSQNIREKIVYRGEMNDIENAMHMLSSLDTIQRFGASRVIASIVMRNYLYKKATGYSYDEFIQLAELLRVQIGVAAEFSHSRGSDIQSDLMDFYSQNGMQIEYEFLGQQSGSNSYGLYALFAAIE